MSSSDFNLEEKIEALPPLSLEDFQLKKKARKKRNSSSSPISSHRRTETITSSIIEQSAILENNNVIKTDPSELKQLFGNLVPNNKDDLLGDFSTTNNDSDVPQIREITENILLLRKYETLSFQTRKEKLKNTVENDEDYSSRLTINVNKKVDSDEAKKSPPRTKSTLEKFNNLVEVSKQRCEENNFSQIRNEMFNKRPKEKDIVRLHSPPYSYHKPIREEFKLHSDDYKIESNESVNQNCSKSEDLNDNEQLLNKSTPCVHSCAVVQINSIPVYIKDKSSISGM